VIELEKGRGVVGMAQLAMEAGEDIGGGKIST